MNLVIGLEGNGLRGCEMIIASERSEEQERESRLQQRDKLIWKLGMVIVLDEDN